MQKLSVYPAMQFAVRVGIAGLLLLGGLLSWGAERPLPPTLPGGIAVATDTSPDFLKAPATAQLRAGVVIAKEAPTIDFAFFFGQDHKGNPWSNWGDGSAIGDKYYTAIGDHLSPRGTAQVYEYDRITKKLRLLFDAKKFLENTPGILPEGMNYTPGKIHSRIDIGGDGMVYYSTHRGSARTTTDAFGYQGDWIFRVDPKTEQAEIVAAHPVSKHCIPASVLDPQRMIFYGGTAAGADAVDKGVQFFAYDVKNNKLLLKAADGFDRYAIFSSSTGRIYWGVQKPDRQSTQPATDGRMYDPATNTITPANVPHVRSATRETPGGWVYGTSGTSSALWAFNVRTGERKELGPAAVAKAEYITSMDADAAGRYLYYAPGAHGGNAADGTPVIQYDTKTNTRKVLCFLADYYGAKYGYIPDGTFSSALSPDGATLYVTWNEKGWNHCAMMAIHIPESERR
jgi:hypothetical protein